MATIVIGLDGANWEMLDDWLTAGDLPRLRRLVDAGVGGTSRSCLPPLTVPNWRCYATGKNPGKLDVFRFDRIDTEAREHVFHDRTDFKSATLWDYLNDEGKRTGIVNSPSTYPPRSIDGFVVAGGPDASETAYRSLESGFATPESVERYLQETLDYRLHPEPMISPADQGAAEIEAILDLIDLRFEAAERLFEREKPDFLHLTVFYSMALQHYFFTDEPVRRAWKRIDENLARFLDRGHDLLLMSDHGTWHVDTVFYVNVWLESAGYLATRRSVDSALGTVGITRERALAVAKRLGMVDHLRRLVPERVQKMLPWEEGVKADRVLTVVDWDRTRAIASNQGPIYLTAERGTPEYEALRTELIERLESLTHPLTGDRLVGAVHRGEEYYDGPYAGNAPDLLLDQGENVHTSDAIGPDSWWADEGVWAGGNMPEGIFLASGPSFDDRGLTERADIVDLAPTLLHAMGAAVPRDVDGDVLDIFAPGSEPADREVRYREPIHHDGESAGEEGEAVEERLANLGYLE